MMHCLNSWEEALTKLTPKAAAQVRQDEPMGRHTTLRVGGPADYYVEAKDTETLVEVAALSQRYRLPLFLLGDGSNVCVADTGVRGLVLHNRCRQVAIGIESEVDSGCNFMRLCIQTMQAGLSGLEFAVGIPGTVGGALVSNAGAYRANICDLVQRIEVVEEGQRRCVGPEWMEFSYRDSRLRRSAGRPAVLVGVTLRLKPGSRREIRLKARDIQWQRIMKQPWEPSAGSWFKNVDDRDLAEKLPGLPSALKQAGVVPAAYLSEACGCKGYHIGRAGISSRHANFVINRGGATASEIRQAAAYVKARVLEQFDLLLQEEVLCVGDWPAGERW